MKAIFDHCDILVFWLLVLEVTDICEEVLNHSQTNIEDSNSALPYCPSLLSNWNKKGLGMKWLRSSIGTRNNPHATEIHLDVQCHLLRNLKVENCVICAIQWYPKKLTCRALVIIWTTITLVTSTGIPTLSCRMTSMCTQITFVFVNADGGATYHWILVSSESRTTFTIMPK